MIMTTKKISDFLAANNADPSKFNQFMVQNNFGKGFVIDEKPIDDFYTCLQIARQQFEEEVTSAKLITVYNNSKMEFILFSWRKKKAPEAPNYTKDGDTGVIINSGVEVYVDLFSDRQLNKKLGQLISDYIVK
ncbi:hypothetical protein [Secundilactobacillus yichangensis]|uniref:hypothetical protein n=1 Tax=Secundilactobacillus yichangensis TaxID=2799580 RepID=UPI001945A167|nr:hypothetical protein [Secundilactobacillus yichangensis]